MVYLNALKEQTHRTMEESAPTLDSLKKEYDFAYRFADFLPRSSASAATMQEYSLFLECSLKAHEAAVSSKPETKSEAASSKPRQKKRATRSLSASILRLACILHVFCSVAVH